MPGRTSSTAKRRYQLPRPMATILLFGALVVIFEAFQLQVLGRIGLTSSFFEQSMVYLLLGLFVGYWARRFASRLIHQWVDFVQRRRVAGREPASFELLMSASSMKMSIEAFSEQWQSYFGRLGVNPRLLRSSDTVSQLGMRLFTYESGDDRADRSVTYIWRPDLTVAELFDAAQGFRVPDGRGIAPLRIWARLGFEFTLLTLFLLTMMRVNPVKYVQQMGWASTSGVLTALAFEPYHVPGGKFQPQTIEYIPQWTYRFSVGGTEFTGSSVAQFTGPIGEDASLKLLHQFSGGNGSVVVLYDDRDKTRNAATLENNQPDSGIRYKVLYFHIMLCAALSSGYLIDLMVQLRLWRRPRS